jgi:small subunit ribosomal protein S18
MKQDFFSANNIKHIDYKSIDILKKFIGPHGNLMSRKRTGLSAKHQRQVENAVKRARFMGLMPFVQK